MSDQLPTLLSPRRGHFRYESGRHGDLWLEIPRLFLRPELVRPLSARLATLFGDLPVEMVCGPAVEGALVACQVAEEMRREFCFAERVLRRGDGGSDHVEYRIPLALRTELAGKRVLVVDDVVNAGSALRSTIADLQQCGARPLALGALLVLGTAGDDLAEELSIPCRTLSRWASSLWTPEDCPLCSAGIPLSSHVTE